MDDDMQGSTLAAMRSLWNDQLSTYMRVMVGLIGLALVFLGWEPLFNPDSIAYDRPLFEGVKAFASMTAWGLGFWVPGVLLLMAAVNGRAVLHVMGAALGVCVLIGWQFFVVVTWQTNPEAIMTTGALGYYIMALTITLGLAFSPNQLKRPPVMAVVQGSALEVPVQARQHTSQ